MSKPIDFFGPHFQRKIEAELASYISRPEFQGMPEAEILEIKLAWVRGGEFATDLVFKELATEGRSK